MRRHMHRPLCALLTCGALSVASGCPQSVPDDRTPDRSAARTAVPRTVPSVVVAPSSTAAKVASAAPIVPAPSAAPPAASAGEPEGAPPLRRFTHIDRDRSTSGKQRTDFAEQEKTGLVKSLFSKAGVGWPPRQLLMRGFKKEGRLEMWASGDAKGPLTHVTTYEICYASGELGPKRQEGDHQVPEGFYRIVWFKPKSSYHLSMQVSYPNPSDKRLGHKKHPGGEIMIHGDCVSVGCLAMSDERIEEIWVIARAAPRPIDVHLFPTRDMAGLVAAQADSPHHAFWKNLEEGFDRFNKTHERFGVRYEADGRYRFVDR